MYPIITHLNYIIIFVFIIRFIASLFQSDRLSISDKMLKYVLEKLENPKRPLLGPNVKALKFWGILLPDNFWKKCFYILMHILVTIFTITEYIDVWYVKSDLNLLLNNLKITMLATMSVCKVATFLLWQKYWKGIIEYVTKADLYQRATSDVKKMDIINSFTKYSRTITYLYWSLMYTTVTIVITQPIFKYVISETYKENIKNGIVAYEPVVSSWVPFDKNNIVGYLAASAWQSYAAIYGGGWITAFDTNAIVTMVFFRAELELIKEDCTNIFGDELKTIDHITIMDKLKDCHRRHIELVKYARIFDSCLSPIMLLYTLVCSIMLCVTAYQITIETNAARKFLIAEYLVFGVAQLFIYCWHSNNVFLASQDLMNGPYQSTWWAKDVKYRKDLYILTAQLSKNIVFSVGPFTYLTVATFINILKGAYSYYTLLSKSQI